MKKTTKEEPVPVLTGMTWTRWIRDANNTEKLIDLYNAQPILADWLSVLWNAMPRTPRNVDLSPTCAAVELGRKEGYLEAITNLQACLTRALPARNPTPMTWGVTEEK